MLDAQFVMQLEATQCPYCGSKISTMSEETATNLTGYRLKQGEDNTLRAFITATSVGIPMESETLTPSPEAIFAESGSFEIKEIEKTEVIDGLTIVYSHPIETNPSPIVQPAMPAAKAVASKEEVA
jgi:hypothetical protein